MKAYHNDSNLKKTMVDEALLHQKTDRLRQGFGYGKYDRTGEFRGCAVGCTLFSVNRLRGKSYSHDDHSAYETALGIPRILARLEDGIFEGLPNTRALTWPHEFLEAVHVGADLSSVGDQFMHWLLVDPKGGVIRFANNDQTRTVITRVGDLYFRRLNGQTVLKRNGRPDAAAAAAADAAATAAAAADAAAAAADATTTTYTAAAAAADAAAAAAATAAAAADAAAADAAAAAAATTATDAAAAAAAATTAAAAAAAAAATTTTYTAAAAARRKARVQQAEKLLELLRATQPTT